MKTISFLFGIFLFSNVYAAPIDNQGVCWSSNEKVTSCDETEAAQQHDDFIGFLLFKNPIQFLEVAYYPETTLRKYPQLGLKTNKQVFRYSKIQNGEVFVMNRLVCQIVYSVNYRNNGQIMDLQINRFNDECPASTKEMYIRTHVKTWYQIINKSHANLN